MRYMSDIAVDARRAATNMLGQPPDFRLQFLTRMREAATRHELPEDALVFAEARRRQTELERATVRGQDTRPLQLLTFVV